MKRALTWSTIAQCLALTGLLAACDARQWPLADYKSGQPRATEWRQPNHASGRPAASSQQSARQSAPTERNVTATKPAPSSGAVTASAAMPGPVSESSDVSLIGLDMAQAKNRLGPPAEEVEQSPAKVWRYRTAQCSLDVSLYPDVHTQVFRILSYEVKGNDGTEQGRRKCISDLRTGSLGR